MRDQVVTVIANHPEIRSVVVMFDYKGGLNDANVDKALWLGENGPVKGLDAMFGTLTNLLRTTQFVMGAIDQRAQGMREEAAVIGAELLKRKKALQELEQRINDCENKQ